MKTCLERSHREAGNFCTRVRPLYTERHDSPIQSLYGVKSLDLAAIFAGSENVITSDLTAMSASANIDNADNVLSNMVGDRRCWKAVHTGNVLWHELVALHQLIAENEVDRQVESLFGFFMIVEFNREHTLVELLSIDVDDGLEVLWSCQRSRSYEYVVVTCSVRNSDQFIDAAGGGAMKA